MSVLDNLPHTARIDRFSNANDSLGANLPTAVEIESGVRCWVQNASMGEIEAYQKRDQQVTHKVFFTAKPPLRVGDQLTITATEGPDSDIVGVELKFQALTDRSAGCGILYAAMCQEENNPRLASFP